MLIYFARGMAVTYSRQSRRILADDGSKNDIIYPRKRVRMDDSGNVVTTVLPVEPVEIAPSSTAPSSPAPYDSALLSSDPVCDGSASPPSSPPPRLPSPAFKPSKTTSTFLKRKRSTVPDDEAQASEALAETSENKMGKVPAGKKARHLTQMQIDLGGETRKACKGCGMDYIPSNKEDVDMHKEFHSMNIRGVDMGKAFLKEVKTLETVDGGEVLSIVNGRNSLAIKNKARKVLEVVNKELGAVDIEESTLWESHSVPTTEKTQIRRVKTRRNSGTIERKEDRFKFFLYMVGDKCVGLCLAERIHNAAKVVTPKLPQLFNQGHVASTRSSSISMAATRDPALLGISRIWTLKSHRRKGIASSLLDCARGNFFYGIEVPKEMVAFSQPSESGGRLAEAWFGDAAGWHVYAEGQ